MVYNAYIHVCDRDRSLQLMLASECTSGLAGDLNLDNNRVLGFAVHA